MRPSREAFEALLLDLRYAAADCERDGRKYDYEERDKANAALMAVYEAQEAKIRELADALEAVLDNVPTCVFVDAYPWDGRCGIHDFTVQEPGKCAIQRAVDVLARTRGES